MLILMPGTRNTVLVPRTWIRETFVPAQQAKKAYDASVLDFFTSGFPPQMQILPSTSRTLTIHAIQEQVLQLTVSVILEHSRAPYRPIWVSGRRSLTTMPATIGGSIRISLLVRRLMTNKPLSHVEPER